MTKVAQPGNRARTQIQVCVIPTPASQTGSPCSFESEKHPHLPGWTSSIYIIPLKARGNQDGRRVLVNVSLALTETSTSCQVQSIFVELVELLRNSFLSKYQSGPNQKSYWNLFIWKTRSRLRCSQKMVVGLSLWTDRSEPLCLAA